MNNFHLWHYTKMPPKSKISNHPNQIPTVGSPSKPNSWPLLSFQSPPTTYPSGPVKYNASRDVWSTFKLHQVSKPSIRYLISPAESLPSNMPHASKSLSKLQTSSWPKPEPQQRFKVNSNWGWREGISLTQSPCSLMTNPSLDSSGVQQQEP